MAFPAAGTKKTPRKPFRLNLLSRRDGKHHSDQQANSEYHTLYIDAFSTEAREWLDVESVHHNTYSLGWKRGRRLGLGNFIVVWEGLLKSGQIIALKQMQQGEALLQYEDLKREVYTLLSIRHKNVISYFGIGIESTDVYIVMEFVHGETLRSILDRYGPLSYEKSWHYSRQAFLGLDYLHNNGIVHRDIRAAKMMVSSKDVVKLIGFGSLKSEETKTLTLTSGIEVYWMAPERISQGDCNKKSDVWSLGCTVHEMATTHPPWDGLGLNSFQVLSNIVEGKDIPPLPDSVSPELTLFILRCLVHDPTERPGASELLEDVFLTIQSKPITDERAQEIIDEAMESGSLQQRNVVGLITGLMGSGKTTLLHYLFGLAPPGLYTSTGVAEQSFRGLLHHILRISAGVWRRLSYKDIREVLALLMQAGMKETDIDFLAACLMRDMEPVEETTSMLDSSTISAPASSNTNPTLFAPATSLPQVEKSPSCQEMVPLVKSAAPSNPTDYMLLLELVHMIDTGGQPELMEVMPSLIHNANLSLVLVNLMYGLSEHPPVECHQDGVPYRREVPSHYTGRDVILKLVSTLHARKNLNESFHLLIVATHRDCVESGLVVRVDSLNKELHSLLLPAFEDELILFEAPDKIAFVLNLKNPDDEDKKALELIRTEVGKPALGRTFDTPSSFFVFEQDLVKFAESVAKRDILSLNECRQVGARLRMSDEVVEAALVLFHRQNTFLYFRHVLPNHVFVKPQVPLDIVNGIVRSSYLPLQGVPAKLVSLLKKAVITEELLNNDKIISPHFKKGFYEAQDAIKLFCHTFIIAPLQSDATDEGTDDSKKEYLMMCLKPAIPDQELHRYIPKSSDTVPLVVKFSSGCVPMGCFGSTVSCLLSQYDWQVICRNRAPQCLAHNIASLHDPDLLVNVVFVDLIKYLELHISSDMNIHDSPAHVISNQLREKVLGAIEKVFEVMHIDKNQITLSSSVFCSCTEGTERHCADFVNRKGKHLLCCELSQISFKPSKMQLFWMGIDSTPKNLEQPQHPQAVSSASQAPLPLSLIALPNYTQNPQFQGHPQLQGHPQYPLVQGYQHLPPYQSQLMQPMQLNQPPQGLSQYQYQLQPLPQIGPKPPLPFNQSFHNQSTMHQSTSHQLPNKLSLSAQTQVQGLPSQQSPLQLNQNFENQSILDQAIQLPQSTPLQLLTQGELRGSMEGLNIGVHAREFTDYSQQQLSQSTPSLLDTPTLPLLHHFPTQSGNVNILERIAVRSHSLGIRLLRDDTGAITSNIEAQYRPDQTRISEAILQRWLEGTGRKPQSWATLVTVLQEIGLSVLAKDIDDNLLHANS